MSDVTTIGLDLAKNVFQVHGADSSGHAVLRKKLRRDQVLAYFNQVPPCVVAMEACGGAHFWGREIGKLGHEVRLIPPAYVKPFVKRQKNDAADAEAICEAAQRPSMRFVPVKSEETQGAAMVFRVRELLIRQRTQAINALRGHLAEFGAVVPQGAANAARLVALVEDQGVVAEPPALRFTQRSSRLGGWHDEAHACPLSHDELVRLQRRASEAWLAVDLAGPGDDVARTA